MYSISKIIPSDKLFSPLLHELSQPVRELYVAGNPTLLTASSLAVVGSRNLTNYGQAVCKHLVTDLVKTGLVIVSGLASGIDAVAHRTALEHKGATIAVLANGLLPNNIFPSEHQQLAKNIVDHGGLLVSEYPPNTVARRYHFPARNRIIAGLTIGTLVIEARIKSGALVTAKQALDLNREIFAVPGSIFSSRSAGTHQLLQHGAKLVTSATDILDELHMHQPITTTALTLPLTLQLSPTEQHIIDALEGEILTAELLSQRLQLSANQLAQHLTALEIQGIVRRNIDYTYEISHR